MFAHLRDHVADCLKLAAIKVYLHHDLVVVLVCDSSVLEEQVCLCDVIDMKACLFLCCFIPQSESGAVVVKCTILAIFDTMKIIT